MVRSTFREKRINKYSRNCLKQPTKGKPKVAVCDSWLLNTDQYFLQPELLSVDDQWLGKMRHVVLLNPLCQIMVQIYSRFQKKKKVHFVFGDFPLPIMLNVHVFGTKIKI